MFCDSDCGERYNPNAFDTNPKSPGKRAAASKPRLRVNVEVLVGGKPLREYDFEGQVFVAARKGEQFTLRLSNNTSGRVLVVASVDGRSIMDGKPAKRKGGHGYVLKPDQTMEVPGWRLDNEDTAHFKFTDGDDPSDAYVVQMGGDPRSLGVIGAAFYEEQPLSRRVLEEIAAQAREQQRQRQSHFLGGGALEGLKGGDDDRQFKGTLGGSPTRSLHADVGTEFGAKTEHKVTNVEFEVGSEVDTLVVQYASAEALRAYGINVVDEAEVAKPRPNPFPGDKPVGCKLPPGYVR